MLLLMETHLWFQYKYFKEKIKQQIGISFHFMDRNREQVPSKTMIERITTIYKQLLKKIQENLDCEMQVPLIHEREKMVSSD